MEQAQHKEKEFCDQKNTEANRIINRAVEIIKSDGKFKNEFITFYKGRYDTTTRTIADILALYYGVYIPIKVREWINLSLISVTIENGRAVGYQYRGSKSKAFFDYFQKIIDVVNGV